MPMYRGGFSLQALTRGKHLILDVHAEADDVDLPLTADLWLVLPVS